MSKYSAANWSWTPVAVANASTMTANGAWFCNGGGASQQIKYSEIYMGGLASSSAPCQMMVARDSTVAATAITQGTNGSLALIDVTATAPGTVPGAGWSATTMPQRSASLQLLNLGFNAYGGIVRWVAYPGEEIVTYGNAINVGEISLSANTGGTPGLMMSHVILEST